MTKIIDLQDDRAAAMAVASMTVSRWLSRAPRVASLRSLVAAGQPTPAQALAFITDELPVRNAWLASQLSADASPFAHVEEYGAFISHLADAAGAFDAARGESSADDARTLVTRTHDTHEAAVRALMPQMRECMRLAQDVHQLGAVQRVCARVHRQLVAQRVLIAHLCLAVDKGYFERGNGGDGTSRAVVEDGCDLIALTRAACADAELAAREKHGDAPAIIVEEPAAGVVGAARRCCTVPSYVFFCLMELLKNAAGAHVQRYGVLDLCDAPPVSVRIAAEGGVACVCVADHGGGMGPDARQNALAYFFTTHEERAATYTYSRAFGEPLAGLGVGLPLAAAHARFLGGDIVLASMPGEGVSAYLTFDRVGGQRTDPPAHEDEFGRG